MRKGTHDQHDQHWLSRQAALFCPGLSKGLPLTSCSVPLAVLSNSCFVDVSFGAQGCHWSWLSSYLSLSAWAHHTPRNLPSRRQCYGLMHQSTGLATPGKGTPPAPRRRQHMQGRPPRMVAPRGRQCPPRSLFACLHQRFRLGSSRVQVSAEIGQLLEADQAYTLHLFLSAAVLNINCVTLYSCAGQGGGARRRPEEGQGAAAWPRSAGQVVAHFRGRRGVIWRCSPALHAATPPQYCWVENLEIQHLGQRDLPHQQVLLGSPGLADVC